MKVRMLADNPPEWSRGAVYAVEETDLGAGPVAFISLSEGASKPRHFLVSPRGKLLRKDELAADEGNGFEVVG